jgi:hypothetical protein
MVLLGKDIKVGTAVVLEEIIILLVAEVVQAVLAEMQLKATPWPVLVVMVYHQISQDLQHFMQVEAVVLVPRVV